MQKKITFSFIIYSIATLMIIHYSNSRSYELTSPSEMISNYDELRRYLAKDLSFISKFPPSTTNYKFLEDNEIVPRKFESKMKCNLKSVTIELEVDLAGEETRRRRSTGRRNSFAQVEALAVLLSHWSKRDIAQFLAFVLVVSVVTMSGAVYNFTLVPNLLNSLIHALIGTVTWKYSLEYCYGDVFERPWRMRFIYFYGLSYWATYTIMNLNVGNLLITNFFYNTEEEMKNRWTWPILPEWGRSCLLVPFMWHIVGNAGDTQRKVYMKWYCLLFFEITYGILFLSGVPTAIDGMAYAFVSLPVFLALPIVALADVRRNRERPITNNGYYFLIYMFLATMTGAILGLTYSSLKKDFGYDKEDFAIACSLSIQVMSSICLWFTEKSARLATDEARYTLLMLPTYLAVDLFQSVIFVEVSILKDPVTILKILVIQELGSLAKNAGLSDFVLYLVRLFCGGSIKGTRNPYNSITYVRRLLAKGAVDTVAEVMVSYACPTMIILEVFLLRVNSESAKCLLMCDNPAVYEDMERRNSTVVDLKSVKSTNLGVGDILGDLLVTYTFVFICRMLCLMLERKTLHRIHSIAMESSGAVRPEGKSIEGLWGGETLLETINRVFVGERKFAFVWLVWTFIMVLVGFRKLPYGY